MRSFQITAPDDLAGAVRLSQQCSSPAFYAGGTELLLVMKQRIAQFDHLIDLKAIPGLKGIRLTDEALYVGALTTHREVERSPVAAQHLPLLVEVESQVANVRVRTVGTLGGNLCFAEPHSDLGLVTVLLDATLTLHGPDGERTVPAADFFVGAYTTVRQEGEILTGIRFPLLPVRSAHSYLRFRYHERPSVAVGVILSLSADGRGIASARVAVGCVGPVPRRVPQAEALLAGRPLSELADGSELVAAAARAAADGAEAQTDLSGSAEYKAHLAGVYVARGICSAVDRLKGGGANA